MEVKCVLDGLGEILQFVESVLCQGQELVRSMDSMESDRTIFVTSSQGLARLDDKVTLLRSLVAKLPGGEPLEAEEGKEREHFQFSLNVLIQRKFADLEEGAELLVSQVQAVKLQLSSQVERVVERAETVVGETNLTESFTTVTQLLAEAEVEVAKGLQVDKDKAPRLSIRIVIWISPSDTDQQIVRRQYYLQVLEDCRRLLPQGVWKGKHAFDQTGEFINLRLGKNRGLFQ